MKDYANYKFSTPEILDPIYKLFPDYEIKNHFLFTN